MKYTTSKKADKVVEKDLEKIKKIVIREFKPISVILFGGFGRGEGTYEIIKGNAVPLNDYDLYIVTKKKIPEKKLEEIGKKCSKAIGKGGEEFVEKYRETYDKDKYFHVDLRWLDYNKLGEMKKVNRTYELKHASRVIYGKDVREKIRDIEIPISEAFRYLINPACHLLLVMDERRLKGNWKGDEKFYALHHIIKAELACASSLVISEGKFKATYKETVEECEKIYKKEFPDLIDRIKEALKMKLYPQRNVSDIKRRWFQARDDLTFVLSYISREHLNIKEKKIKELAKRLYEKLPYVYFTPYLPLPSSIAQIAFPSQYFLNILYFFRTRYFRSLLGWRDVGLKIAVSAFLLLHALNDRSLLDDAYSYIKTFSRVKSRAWKDLRMSLLYAFDRYYSQKLI
jgi:predicted nucleotidyltransferase